MKTLKMYADRVSTFVKHATVPQKVVIFSITFALLGSLTLLFTDAATLGTSSIGGFAYQDANRNGIKDDGELPWVGQVIQLYTASGENIAGFTTDSNGYYHFDNLMDGSYTVSYPKTQSHELGKDWAPTTNNWQATAAGNAVAKAVITLDSHADVNFGWRKILRSTVQGSPISTYTGPTGLKAEVYNDVVDARTFHDAIITGGLIGDEAKYTTARLDLGNVTVCYYGASQAYDGRYINYSATLNVAWSFWLSTGDTELFHEYGHAWSMYNAYIAQQDPTLNGYLKARGLDNDSRISSNVYWNPQEMIAEDYRQLFGTTNAQSRPQANREIPVATNVVGLREYLSGSFLTGPSDNTPPSAPTSLSAASSLTSETPQVKLTWLASTDNKAVDHYDIYRNGSKVGFVNHPSTTFIDSNLNYSTKYDYFLKAIDEAGNQSPVSTTVSTTTPGPDTQAPSAPTNLMSPAQTSSSISLNWSASNDNVGVKEYQIYRFIRKGSAELVAITPSTNYVVGNLSRFTNYSYYVLAVDISGNRSLLSKTLTVKTKR